MGLSSNEFLLGRIRKKVPFFFLFFFVVVFIVFLLLFFLNLFSCFPYVLFSRHSMVFWVVGLISQGRGVVYFRVFH